MITVEDAGSVALLDDGGALEASPDLRRRWKPGWLTLCIAMLALGGVIAGLYPMTAAWVSSYNQSRVLVSYESEVRDVKPDASEQLREARAYNDALSAGVQLNKNANVPVGDGALDGGEFDYDSILSANAEGLMARVKIPAIDVDLPVFHGTTDAVLSRGAGHLEGSHFPIGGRGTRSVITAHRGLANATMFTDLDKVVVGDRIIVETFGKTLTYRVRDIQVIEPEENSTIRAEADSDLLTLITCTPLGINTHRIVVTAERITPTPESDIREAGQVPTIPGFPWWAAWGGLGLVLIAAYVIWQGFVDARQSKARTTTPEGDKASEHGADEDEPAGGPARPPYRRRGARRGAAETTQIFEPEGRE